MLRPTLSIYGRSGHKFQIPQIIFWRIDSFPFLITVARARIGGSRPICGEKPSPGKLPPRKSPSSLDVNPVYNRRRRREQQRQVLPINVGLCPELQNYVRCSSVAASQDSRMAQRQEEVWGNTSYDI